MHFLIIGSILAFIELYLIIFSEYEIVGFLLFPFALYFILKWQKNISGPKKQHFD